MTGYLIFSAKYLNFDANAGRRTKFAPVKKLSDLKVLAKSPDLKFRFTVFCPPFSFFKPRKEKPPKRPGANT